MTTTLPTTYREIDSSPIEMEQAKEQWAVAARPELERVARSYGEVIRYSRARRRRAERAPGSEPAS